jgi:histone deacetylase 1/2
MPTSILSNKSPFECLFRQTPDYAFLRTFGCLCFPFLRPYNAHKLDYHSTPCVFLGYSSSHLGYRCLDLSSDRIYISYHVRFHEQVFPFIEFVIPPHPPLRLSLSPAYPPHHFSISTRLSPTSPSY